MFKNMRKHQNKLRAPDKLKADYTTAIKSCDSRYVQYVELLST